MKGHHPPEPELGLRLGNLIPARLALASVRLMLATPVSQLKLQVQSGRMAQPCSQALNTPQPRWDHLPMQVNQNNATLFNGPWGAPPGLKLDETIRLGFQNLSSFSESPSHPKNDIFRTFISKRDFDVFGIAGTNANWSVLPATSQFYERARSTGDKIHALFLD